MSTVTPKNSYTAMQFNQYFHGTNNHENHNANNDYWEILLGSVKADPSLWKNKKALDFGCGKARNINNLLKLTNSWKSVDGVDISPANISHCKSLGFPSSSFHVTDGVSVKPLETNSYDFIMSTIVFQHICVYEIRDSLLKDLFRVLTPGGIFSFQMGFGPKETAYAKYHDNLYFANATNGMCDVRVSDEKEITEHLTQIGFVDIKTVVRPSYDDNGHPQWIYVTATKNA